SKIFAGVIGEQPAIVLKLVDDEIVEGGLSRRQSGDRAYRQSACKCLCTGSRWQKREWSRKAGNVRIARQSRDAVNDRLLVIENVIIRMEDRGALQQRDSVLGIGHQAFKRAEEKCLVLLDGKANAATELLPAQ